MAASLSSPRRLRCAGEAALVRRSPSCSMWPVFRRLSMAASSPVAVGSRHRRTELVQRSLSPGLGGASRRVCSLRTGAGCSTGDDGLGLGLRCGAQRLCRHRCSQLKRVWLVGSGLQSRLLRRYATHSQQPFFTQTGTGKQLWRYATHSQQPSPTPSSLRWRPRRQTGWVVLLLRPAADQPSSRGRRLSPLHLAMSLTLLRARRRQNHSCAPRSSVFSVCSRTRMVVSHSQLDATRRRGGVVGSIAGLQRRAGLMEATAPADSRLAASGV